MSALSLKIIYYVFFHLAMSYGIIFWGISLYSSIIFRTKKKRGGGQLKKWKKVGIEFHLKIYLKNKKFFFFK